MKRFSALSMFMAIIVILFLTLSPVFAQTATPAATTTPAAATTPAASTEGFNLGLLAVGQDNIWAVPLGGSGPRAAFFAVGAGMDIAQYKKTLNAAGGALVVTLHAGGAAIATGRYAGDALGYASLNVDLLQLIVGQPITILTTSTTTTAKLLLGPLLSYNGAQNNVPVGGLLNFTLNW
jgi:hypothetical protein